MMINRRTLLSAAALSSLPLLRRPAFSQVAAEPGLAKIASEKGITYGAAVRASRLRSVPQYVEAIKRECAMAVSEGEMRWAQLQPSPDHFDFKTADYIVDFCVRNGLQIRGHELIRTRSSPDWVERSVSAGGRANAERIMANYITTVVKHYEGTIKNWDVINESLSPNIGLLSRRKNFWYHALGQRYIDLAFEFAHAAAPDVELVCNDNQIQYDTEEQEFKRRALLDLLTGFRKNGTPCHAVGLQSHLIVDMPFNERKFAEFLQNIADMDYEILVTELDVDDTLQGVSIEKQDQIVADTTERYLDVALAQPKVKTVLSWGITDRYSARTSFHYNPNNGDPKRQQKLADHILPRPLPLDTDYHRKPMWHAMARAFRNAPNR